VIGRKNKTLHKDLILKTEKSTVEKCYQKCKKKTIRIDLRGGHIVLKKMKRLFKRWQIGPQKKEK
jgi:hypothetical protein